MSHRVSRDLTRARLKATKIGVDRVVSLYFISDSVGFDTNLANVKLNSRYRTLPHPPGKSRILSMGGACRFDSCALGWMVRQNLKYEAQTQSL